MTYSNTYSSPSSPTNFNPFSGMGMRKGGRPSLFPGSGDGSTLSLDFTTGVLDPRLTFSRAGGGTYVGSDGYIYGVDSATSASLAIGTGSKSVTLTATAGVDRRFQVGQTVYFSSGANNMNGLVTAYNASTQVITINATATTGSGSFTSWFVGNASPRFDYSPTNIGEPRGLLVEGSSINACTYSEDFANAAWNKVNITQTPASGTSPDNTNTATLLAEIVGYGKHSLDKSITVTAGNIYTFSVFLKEASSNSRRYACVQVADGQATAARNTVVVDLQTGTVTANGVTSGTLVGSPTDVAHSITSYKDGWYRVTVTMKFVSSPCYPVVMLSDISTLFGGPNQPFYTAASPVKGLLVGGAQLELGSSASSYIPTGASQVTRNADHCTMPTASFIPGNPYPQTLFVDCIPNTPSGAFLDLLRVMDRTVGGTFGYGHQIYYYNAATMIAMRKISASTNTERNIASGLAYGTRHKFALSIDASSFSGSYDGVTSLGVATAPTALATVVTHLGIGCTGDSSPNAVMFGTIRQIKFYPTALSQSAINTLTTL